MTGSSEETYTNRRTEDFTVKALDEGKDSVTIHTTRASGFIIPLTEGNRQIREGGTYLLELKGFNDIGGILAMDGGYLMRRSDQYFERQREQYLAEVARRNREQLEANRDDWQAREDALPAWIRGRLARFWAAGGEHFALEGWAYELTICELAVIYERNGLVDDDEVARFASLHGTSGNQHSCALALARNKAQAASFPAGLSPLSGDPDYSAGAKAAAEATR